MYVIPCSATKGDTSAPARFLYRSKRFAKQVAFIEAMGANYAVFSAKHGIVDPSFAVDPYDVPLSGLSDVDRLVLRKRCADDLSLLCMYAQTRTIVILGASDGLESQSYNDFLKTVANDVTENVVFIPAHEVDALTLESIGVRKRVSILRNFYRGEGGFSRLLGPFPFDKMPTEHLPKSGVYFFTDDAEVSRISGSPGRIVRVGTHGVSQGSKATLAQRLRAHFGLGNGAGNHRSSIFRLHVGECLIRSGQFPMPVDSWQKELPTDDASYALERQLELAVSNYIRRLNLWFLEINGPSHKNSKRSTQESRFIKTLTADGLVIDMASAEWLGRHSTRRPIAFSGLWNVQHVGISSFKPNSQLQLL